MSDSTVIKEFITRRWSDSDCKWTTGNCYWFAVILVTRFPCLKIYYEPIIGHFVAGDGITFYDINGEYISNNLKALEEIEREDTSLYKRLVRDCVL